MKTPTIIGILLIIVGIVVLAIGGFTVTKREKVLDIGPLQASVDKKETHLFSPWIGYASLAGGVVLVAAGSVGRKV